MIDCAFIDKENQRWIVDYKLVQTKDYCIDVLIQKYSTQMNKYADGLSKLEKRSIRKGLYLPLQSEWIEL